MVVAAKELYCGIDVHYKRSFVCILNNKAEKIDHREIPTNEENIKELFQKYSTNKISYAFESCGMSRYLNDVLIQLPNTKKIHLVNTNKFKIITESKHKNDKEDSRKLAEGLIKEYLPEKVHLKSEESRQIQLLLNLRQRHVKYKTSILQQIKSLFRSKGVPLTKSVDLKNGFLHLVENIEGFNEFDHNILKYQNKDLVEIKQKIADLEKDIKCLTEKHFPKEIELLRSIPGIGFVISAYLVACIDDIKRFKKADQLVAYFGLSPSEYSSGEKIMHGAITKQGNKHIRRMLIQASWVIISKMNNSSDERMSKICRKYYGMTRKNKVQKAIVMVARRLAKIIFGVLKNNQTYSSTIEQR